MAKGTIQRRHSIDDISRHFEPVEVGWSYWLEHVVHWYALLGAVVAILVVGLSAFGHGAVAPTY
ncbi:MAG: hypothetical protein ABIK13_03340 [Patescibacteria group bacterium]